MGDFGKEPWMRSQKWGAALLIAFAMIIAFWVWWRLVQYRPLSVTDPYRLVESRNQYDTSILPITVRNSGLCAVTIVGASDHCEPSGCTETKGLPLLIPALESKTFEVVFHSGAFDSGQFVLLLYTDWADQPNVKITFKPQELSDEL